MQGRVYSITFLTKKMEIMDLNAYENTKWGRGGFLSFKLNVFSMKKNHMGWFQIQFLDVNIQRHGLVAWVGKANSKYL